MGEIASVDTQVEAKRKIVGKLFQEQGNSDEVMKISKELDTLFLDEMKAQIQTSHFCEQSPTK